MGTMNSHEVREYNTILERARHPNQIQWILIHAHLPRQTARVVAAQERPTVWVYADAEIAHPHFQSRLADYIRYRCRDARVHLRGVEGRGAFLVVERDEEDARYQR